MNLTLNQFSRGSSRLWRWPCNDSSCYLGCSPYRKVGKKKKKRQYHIFPSGLFISVHIVQNGGVCFRPSLCLLTILCCDRLHRGCSPSIHFCPSLRSSPSPSVAPFWHRRPDSLPIHLPFCPIPRLRQPPVGLMFFRCDRSRVNLQVSPLSISACSRSLPSSSQWFRKCKCVHRSSRGWGGGGAVPVNAGPVAMLSHLVSSSCHFFSVSAAIPQLLRNFEKVRTLWIPKGLSGRILSHKWVTL